MISVIKFISDSFPNATEKIMMILLLYNVIFFQYFWVIQLLTLLFQCGCFFLSSSLINSNHIVTCSCISFNDLVYTYRQLLQRHFCFFPKVIYSAS